MSNPEIGFSLDPRLGLVPADELGLLHRAAELGYTWAWTPSGPDLAAFERCLRWHREAGLATGIAVVPASGCPPRECAEAARKTWEQTDGRFVLGVGAGGLERPLAAMRDYLLALRELLPEGPPIHLGALGPAMLGLAGELADGASLNWCSQPWVAWS